MEPSQPHEGGDGDDAVAGTLAGASGQALNKFLQSRQSRKGQQKFQQILTESAEGTLPRGPQAATLDGLCGAPAGAADDDEQQPALRAKGRSTVEDTPAAPVPWLPSGRMSGSEDEEEERDEWEAASDFEGFFEDVQGQEVPSSSTGGGLVISLEGAAGGSGEGQPRRRRFTKEEILSAALVHQAHLLCLLARGQMFDLAAATPLVQATAMSTAPEGELQTLHPGILIDGLKASGLTSFLDWYKRSFRLVEGGSSTLAGELQVTADEEGGVAATVRGLQVVAAERKGTAEQLVALFVALLRSAGILTRFVRTLDPLPWRPTVRERHLPRRPRHLKRSAEEVASADGSRGSKKPRRAAAVASGGRGRKGRGVEASGDKESDEDGDVQTNLAPQRKGGKKAAAKGTAAKAGSQKKQESAAADDSKQSPADANGAHRRKRGKGDLEFENQIAMAMMTSGGGTCQEEKENGRAATSKVGQAVKASGAAGLGAAWDKGANLGQVADCWAEVYCSAEDEGQGRWVHLHPLLGWMDRPELVENAGVRSSQLAYVIAFAGGGAKDVTSRYISNLQAAEKVKKPNAKWWGKTLKPLRTAEVQATANHLARQQEAQGGENLPNKADSSAGTPESSPALSSKPPQSLQKLKQEVKARAHKEDEDLKRRVEKQQREVPMTLEGFRSHKHFVLQRHIPRYSAVRPGAQKAGFHRGEPYFLAADVSELHTADKWVQLGREVAASELQAPFKVAAKRGSKKKAEAARDAGDADEEERKKSKSALPEDESQQTKLYGRWQTQPWRVPIAQNGVVPKNERGTVHCPPLAAALPQGTRQIDKARVAGVCKRLCVDYAMAMTGFDFRGGRSVPRFEGVVVCEEFAELVLAEWEKEHQERAEKEAAKRMETARATWVALLRGIFTRLGLQDQMLSPGKAAGRTAKKPSIDGADSARDSDTSEKEPPPPKKRKPSRAGAACGREQRRSGGANGRAVEEASKDDAWKGAAVPEYEEI